MNFLIRRNRQEGRKVWMFPRLQTVYQHKYKLENATEDRLRFSHSNLPSQRVP